MRELPAMHSGPPPLVAVVAPALGGGIGRVIVNLANAFVGDGVAVDVLLAKTGGPFVAALRPEVRVTPIRSTHLLTGVPSLARYLRRERPRAVLTESPRGNALVLRAERLSRAGTPVYASIHNTYSQTLATRRPDKRASVVRRLRRYLPRNAGVIAVSRGVADDLTTLVELDPGRLHVIPNPVVTEELRERALAEPGHRWLQDRSLPVVLAAGRLHAQKDFPTLLRAFARARRSLACRLVLLGEGEERASLEALARDLGVHDDVDLPGFVDNPYACMARAAVFVLSSAWEGFGNVLAEALAVGTPVVSTDCPNGPREILQGGRVGVLVPVGDDQAMAAGILESVHHPPDHRFLRQAAEPYRVEVVARRYLHVMGVSTNA